MLVHCGRWGSGAAEGGWGSEELPARSSQVPGAGTKAVGTVRGRRSPNLPLAPTAWILDYVPPDKSLEVFL